MSKRKYSTRSVTNKNNNDNEDNDQIPESPPKNTNNKRKHSKNTKNTELDDDADVISLERSSYSAEGINPKIFIFNNVFTILC